MPKVSVIMPVYNGETYLREAVESILAQTFSDFELLVIDDGSTDNSREIVARYDDPRLKTFRNQENMGIVATLNRGVQLAAGEYIAIMHADDISLPERLRGQARYLDDHPDVAMVAVKVALINAAGKDVGVWPADISTTTLEDIRSLLSRTNCIAHPSVMIRRSVALAYPYNKKQLHTEDYDLWLRLVADNLKIEKLNERLVRYRVHLASITGKTRQDEFKEVRTRTRFLLEALGKFRFPATFHREVMLHTISDFSAICRRRLERSILQVGRSIFVALGKLLGNIYSRLARHHHGILFFFPYPPEHVGGAERVHGDIVAANLRKRPWVVIGREADGPPTTRINSSTARFTDISPLLINPVTKHICIGFFAGYLNRKKTLVFGGNSEFFYWLIPELALDVRCVDMIHGYGIIMNQISLTHVERLNRRVVIARELATALGELYREHHIPRYCLDRIEMIDYGVDLPEGNPRRSSSEMLQILYVGRGTPEKRVHLVGRIASCLAHSGIPAQVTLIGDVQESVDEVDRPSCTFLGEIHDRMSLSLHYAKADMLLITSSAEGVSLVKMEAMASGVVPVAVAVGGIPEHIRDGETGFLVSPDQGEEGIVNAFCGIIADLVKNRGRLAEMSQRTFLYAQANFDRTRALARFSELLDTL